MPKHLDTAAIGLLRKQAQQIIKNQIMPAYQNYYDFMVNHYQPNARKNIAASSLPNGLQYYTNRLQHYTTLPLSAEQVHQIGLTEVARIRDEMNTIISDVAFEGSFADFAESITESSEEEASKALLRCGFAAVPASLISQAVGLEKRYRLSVMGGGGSGDPW